MLAVNKKLLVKEVFEEEASGDEMQDTVCYEIMKEGQIEKMAKSRKP